ncbi:hypothetical protein CALVIDRAFT_594968 [Calocera viscosa TUFC12733]|uniref:Protein-S-isoprenylcysteine O-methyltransferase n=1 Tax=Calocera viscosa (strain TUFC12733) TaxID=1330018 RepID=A0A167RDB1_CALVF|nr:hypothetical protein CALVIDRAFT_594968 [Calocera viscosa TUFC12733]
MSIPWYNAPTSPAWLVTHSVIAMISGYRTATIGIQSPNKDPATQTRYKENAFVVFMLVLLPKAIQVYIGVALAFMAARAGLALAYPDVLAKICTSCPPLWLTLCGITGSLLGWAGTELRVWCYAALGEYFTFRLAVQDKQPLITTGPYTYLRHPSYLGGLLQGLGMELSMILCNPISLCYGRNLFKYSEQLETAFLILMFVAPVAALVRRIGGEERMLKAKFGKEYTEWESRTWRLIPFVY